MKECEKFVRAMLCGMWYKIMAAVGNSYLTLNLMTVTEENVGIRWTETGIKTCCYNKYSCSP